MEIVEWRNRDKKNGKTTHHRIHRTGAGIPTQDINHAGDARTNCRRKMSFVHQGAAKAKTRTAARAKGKARTAARGVRSYQGHCHWCGMWGHTAKFCKQKKQLRGRAAEGCGLKVRQLLSKSPWAIDSSEHAQEGFAALDNSALLGANLEGSSWGTFSNKIGFAAMAETDGEDDDEQCVRQYQVACTQHESQMKTRDREILSVGRVKQLDLTIDSGAVEHVVGPKNLASRTSADI